MSPGISTVVRVPRLRPPRAAVFAALAWTRGESIAMRFGHETGVAPGAFVAEWVVDHKARDLGVNLIGMLLLFMQPARIDGEDPGATVAREIGVTLLWIEALCDGWNFETHDEMWLKANRDAYLNAYEVGFEARVFATLVCDCGARRFKGTMTCLGCGGAR